MCVSGALADILGNLLPLYARAKVVKDGTPCYVGRFPLGLTVMGAGSEAGPSLMEVWQKQGGL